MTGVTFPCFGEYVNAWLSLQADLSGAKIDSGGQYVLLMAQWLKTPGSGANGAEPYIYYSDVSHRLLSLCQTFIHMHRPSIEESFT